MIFLSHNIADKPIVRQIAQSLENVYGRESVFYDEWSIQPGDSIIGKMNNGIEKCKYFFFFVSENSLKSKMVELEWQAAIMKLINGIIFIPVRLDKSLMPAILTQILYIDLYTYGLSEAIRQIIDVINGNNTYRPQNNFSNLVAYIGRTDNKNINIEIRAEYYLEPHSRYLLVVDNNENDLNWTLPDFNMYTSAFNKNIPFTDGEHNCILIEVNNPTSPNFPVKIVLESKSKSRLSLLYIMHATSRKNFSTIPIKYVTKLNSR